MNKSFSVELPGAVWKVLPGESEWVVEWRDGETRTSGFSIVNPESQLSVRVTSVDEAPDWWTTLAGVGQECFFAHGYRQPDIPEATDLLAYDLETGVLKWTLPGCRFVGYSEEGQLILGKKSADRMTLVSSRELTGEIIAEMDESLVLKKAFGTGPDQYRKGDEYYPLLSDSVFKYTGLRPQGVIEYLDYGDRMAFSFYLYETESLTQYVAVLNRFKSLEYLDAIERKLKKEGNGSLLLKEGWLVFVKNRRNLVGIYLAV